MYRRIATTLLIGMAPLAAFAQSSPNDGSAPGQRGITRDQYVQRAADVAGHRFDQMGVR